MKNKETLISYWTDYLVRKNMDKYHAKETAMIIADEIEEVYNKAIKSNDERNEKYWNGFKFACEMLDETYSDCSIHRYMLGDCLLAKVNKLKGKIRENLKANKQKSNDVGDVEKAAEIFLTKTGFSNTGGTTSMAILSSFKAGAEWQLKNG